MATPSLLPITRKKFSSGKILTNGKRRNAGDGATSMQSLLVTEL
jgi:hypothetical protein